MEPNYAIPTLADVAIKADVSTATVSRYLNSPNQLSQITRERVMRAIAELGYSPNFNAQALAARRTNTVGAIIPTMDNAIFARGLQAFQEELGKLGETLIETAVREFQEETQLKCQKLQWLNAIEVNSHPWPRHLLGMFWTIYNNKPFE